MQTALRNDGWTRRDSLAVRGRAFDGERLLEGDALASRIAASSGDDLESLASTATALDGFFAAVVRTDDATFLVADGARSIPLYYDTGGTVVSDRGRLVRDAVDAPPNPVAESEFLLTRYVTGPETIWAGVRAVRPGEVVRIDATGEITSLTYREYWPDGDATTEAHLETAFETAIDRLERVAGDRPIVVPLSGGYDSRLLASALVERDREVIGFTFGKSGHPDVELSREIAARLGIRWEHCEYDAALWRKWYHSPARRRYERRMFGGDALPFLAEWPALRELIAVGRLPTGALYCPGHTVATPSERLPRFVGESDGDRTDSVVGCGPAVDADDDPNRETIEPSVAALVEYVLDRHYALWEWDDEAFEAAARARIERGLLGDRDADSVTDPASAAAAYERWEWRGRMSTFTNGDCRAYEDVGLDWWLPLWDPAYVRAWARVPLEQRRGKAHHANLTVDRYRRAAGVSLDRASLTDRTLPPADRVLAPIRYTPGRQFVENDGEWEPPFLASRSTWSEPGSHPLAWDGIVDNAVLEALPSSQNLYALRTLAATGRLDFATPTSELPDTPTIALPRANGD